MILTSGTLLGPYEIEAPLGAGGMGEVYRARDTRLGRTVAIKVVRSREGVESDQRRRFRREAEITARLTHPHICTLFDVGAEGALDFLVLEHLEGTALAERMDGRPLPPAEAARIAHEIAEALAFAHERGFVHRDLKPANVFLTTSGTKLLDFGLARDTPGPLDADAVDAPTESLPLSTAGTILGTPPYMSPEQAAGKPVDERSDQFSFGSVLFEMLTGRRAFRGASVVETLSAVLKDDPLARADSGTIPPPFAAILSRLLDKDPSRRYPSTRALAAELAQARRTIESGEGAPARIGVSSATAGGATPALAGWRAPGRQRAAIVLAAIGVAAAAAGVLLWTSRRSGTRLDSLAILPIVARPATEESSLLADGMTESLVNALAGIPSLRVMALSSVAAYRGRDVDPREVGRALRVRAVLTGHLVPHGGAVTVSLALADAVDGRHLWGTSSESPSVSLPATQARLARDVGKELARRLTGEQEGRLARPVTENHDAYLLFLKGRYFWSKRDRQSLQKGIDLYRQALDLDPGYARAWTGLAESYDVMGFMKHLPPREAFGEALEAARKATELDPSLADAWAVLAHVTMLFTRDIATAEAQFRKALALNPSCANAHHWYSHLLMNQGRKPEALRESQACLEVDPLSLVMNTHLAEYHFFAGDMDAAVQQVKKTIDLDPRFGQAHSLYGAILDKTGAHEQAIAEFQEAARLLPDSVDVQGQLGAALARSGRRAEAEAILQSLLDARRERYVSGFSMALVSAALGDEERTLAELERGLEAGDTGTATLVESDQRFAFLRDNPRYKALLDRSAARGGASSVPGPLPR